MSERTRLLASIATTISGYRRGEIPTPNPNHVDRWVCQFDEEVQLPILLEMDHVLKRTYISKQRVYKLFTDLVQHRTLVGSNPLSFWKGVDFLNIQEKGASQKDLLALFSEALEKECGFGVTECGADPKSFLYLDDAIFTGNTLLKDLGPWVSNFAPFEATVHIVSIVLTRGGGRWYAKGKIEEAATSAGKNIALTWNCVILLEDRKAYTNTSDVLRPVNLPDDPAVQAYVNSMQYKPHYRNPGHVSDNKIFTGEAGRQILEQEFLKAGVQINNDFFRRYQYQIPQIRPLGNMALENLGFGSLVVTFRNCPNNDPLVLWAENNWYPLFPRKTNKDTQRSNTF